MYSPGSLEPWYLMQVRLSRTLSMHSAVLPAGPSHLGKAGGLSLPDQQAQTADCSWSAEEWLTPWLPCQIHNPLWDSVQMLRWSAAEPPAQAHVSNFVARIKVCIHESLPSKARGLVAVDSVLSHFMQGNVPVLLWGVVWGEGGGRDEGQVGSNCTNLLRSCF